MMYQSTGEVRQPKKGEFFLGGAPNQRTISHMAVYMSGDIWEYFDPSQARVILEPVPEEE